MVQKATELQEKLSNFIDERNIPLSYDVTEVSKDKDSMVLILDIENSRVSYHIMFLDGDIYEAYKQLEYETTPTKTLEEPTVDEVFRFILR